MNKAILISFLSFSAMLYGCSRRVTAIKPEPVRFEFKGRIRSVAFLENYYYLLTYEDRLYRYDKKNAAFDSSYVVDFEEELSSIYVQDDRVQGKNEYKSYLLKNRKWSYLRKVAGEYPGNKIFEDNDYLVSSTCLGEFGGTIFFKSKKDSNVYETSCTCALNVQKQYDGYLVTESLRHGAGFAGFFTISNPTKLPIYKKDNFKEGYRKYTDRGTPRLGKTKNFDSYGMLFLGKFEYNNILHLITLGRVRDFELPNNILSVDVIENDQLRVVREIKSEYIDQSTDFSGSEHQPLVSYHNEKNTGFIDFSDGKVVFYNFPLKK